MTSLLLVYWICSFLGSFLVGGLQETSPNCLPPYQGLRVRISGCLGKWEGIKGLKRGLNFARVSGALERLIVTHICGWFRLRVSLFRMLELEILVLGCPHLEANRGEGCSKLGVAKASIHHASYRRQKAIHCWVLGSPISCRT